MTLDVDLDTGPVHLERRVPVDEKTLLSLLDELAVVGAEALIEVLASRELLASPRAQKGDPTFAAKLVKEEFHLVPSMPVEQLLRVIRLGRAYTMVSGRRLLVESATRSSVEGWPKGTIGVRDSQVVVGAIDGAVILERVRPESGKSMSAMAWWVGSRLEHAALWT
jgi:methionyl-tRNA formyltransferase